MHVAIVSEVGASIRLIHAIRTKGVIEQNLQSAIQEIGDKDKIDLHICKVNTEKDIITKAIKSAKLYIGYPYNDLFASNGINSNNKNSFYCSQLIEHIFNTNSPRELFSKTALNFKDKNGQIMNYWKTSYSTQ